MIRNGMRVSGSRQLCVAVLGDDDDDADADGGGGDWTCLQVSRAAQETLDQLELPVQLDELDLWVNLE